MKRQVRPREWAMIDAALQKAVTYGFALELLQADFRAAITVEVMNRHFTKFHLGRSYALHRFTGVDLGPAHDHPSRFSSLILAPYIEEVYSIRLGEWRSERVLRPAGSTHTVDKSVVHRIVEIPAGESWTLVRYGAHVQRTRFYRFSHIVEARAAGERRWRRMEGGGSNEPQW